MTRSNEPAFPVVIEADRKTAEKIIARIRGDNPCARIEGSGELLTMDIAAHRES